MSPSGDKARLILVLQSVVNVELRIAMDGNVSQIGHLVAVLAERGLTAAIKQTVTLVEPVLVRRDVIPSHLLFVQAPHISVLDRHQSGSTPPDGIWIGPTLGPDGAALSKPEQPVMAYASATTAAT